MGSLRSGGAVATSVHASWAIQRAEDAELEIDPDPALEREAEEAAQRAMEGGPVTVNREYGRASIHFNTVGEHLYERFV